MPSWSNKPSGTMTAAVLTSPGAHPPSACFTLDHAYPKPTLPSEDWVLVRVKAAGLNRAELRGRNGDVPGLGEFGMFRSEYHQDPPKILGEEFVGTIEIAGASTPFKPNDRVAGWVYGGGKAHDGAYAQYTICHASRCFPIPPTSLPWEVLGGIFMSMCTAWGSLFEAAQLRPRSTLLVHGGTSSVGVWAILLAKHHACTVIATTRQESKIAKLEAAGADHAVLESDLAPSLAKLYPKGVDCVLELVGPDHLLALDLPHLARHGTAVVPGVLSKIWSVPDFKPSQIPVTRKLTFYALGSEDAEGMKKVPAAMESVVRKVEEEEVKGGGGTWWREVFLDRIFANGLKEIGAAHEYMEENRAVGKVVVLVL